MQNIFIVAFLLLNVFLIYSYFNRYDLQYASTSNNQIDVLNVMEEEGIELPEFDNNEPTIFSMQANQHNLLQEEAGRLPDQAGSVGDDGSYYTSFLSNPIELEGNMQEGFTENDMATLNTFVESSQVLFGDQYEYGWIDQESSRIIYYQTVDGYPVADGTSEISLYVDSNGNVFSYHQTFAGPMNEQGSPLDIISDREAVKALFQNNEIPSNSTIEEPILSYHRMLYLDDLSMYSPAWVVPVETSNGITRHRVNATNGQIIPEPNLQPEPPTNVDEAVNNSEEDSSGDSGDAQNTSNEENNQTTEDSRE